LIVIFSHFCVQLECSLGFFFGFFDWNIFIRKVSGSSKMRWIKLSELLNKGINYEIYPDKIVIFNESERVEVPLSKISCGFLALNTIYVEVENLEGFEGDCLYFNLKTDNPAELYQCLLDLDINLVRIYTG